MGLKQFATTLKQINNMKHIKTFCLTLITILLLTVTILTLLQLKGDFSFNYITRSTQMQSQGIYLVLFMMSLGATIMYTGFTLNSIENDK